ncbi:MAG: esterase [Lachnospiraceae bacterium]|nr:esterase [Lachnospiraceae bacterium]
MALKYEIVGDPASCYWLIQIMDEQEETEFPKELGSISAGLMDTDYCFIKLTGVDWNMDLTPWITPAVFGKRDFGHGAEETRREMERILHRIAVLNRQHIADKCLVLGGYSLAGLFSLWCAYNSKMFFGVAAASPSVWYPNWIDYVETHECNCRRVYLSLGDREKCSKNELVCQVEEKIRDQLAFLKRDPHVINATLVMNPGNHFQDAAIRMASGFVWVMKEQVILDEAMRRG